MTLAAISILSLISIIEGAISEGESFRARFSEAGSFRESSRVQRSSSRSSSLRGGPTRSGSYSQRSEEVSTPSDQTQLYRRISGYVDHERAEPHDWPTDQRQQDDLMRASTMASIEDWTPYDPFNEYDLDDDVDDGIEDHRSIKVSESVLAREGPDFYLGQLKGLTSVLIPEIRTNFYGTGDLLDQILAQTERLLQQWADEDQESSRTADSTQLQAIIDQRKQMFNEVHMDLSPYLEILGQRTRNPFDKAAYLSTYVDQLLKGVDYKKCEEKTERIMNLVEDSRRNILNEISGSVDRPIRKRVSDQLTGYYVTMMAHGSAENDSATTALDHLETINQHVQTLKQEIENNYEAKFEEIYGDQADKFFAEFNNWVLMEYFNFLKRDEDLSPEDSIRLANFGKEGIRTMSEIFDAMKKVHRIATVKGAAKGSELKMYKSYVDGVDSTLTWNP